jgi:peptide/nickel transport system permease protein
VKVELRKSSGASGAHVPELATFIARRVAQGFVVVACVLALVFVTTRLVTDPAVLLLPPDASHEEREALSRQLGLDRPLPVQFVEFARGAVSLDLGDSAVQHRPALDVVLERFPKTLILAVSGMVLALCIALPAGIVAAARPNSIWDHLMTAVSLLANSVPQFWMALLLVLLFSVNLDWLPTSGGGGLDHLILPAMTVALPTSGRLAVITRSIMIEELNRPWIRASRAKGMPAWRTLAVHAFRNAAIPVLTLAGWEFVRILGGTAVVVEFIFAWPGLGFTALDASRQGDIFVLQAVVLVVAAVTVIVNIAIDVAYKAIDRRVAVA